MEDKDKAILAELKASLDTALDINKKRDVTINTLEDKIKAMEADTESHTQKFEQTLNSSVETVSKKYEDKLVEVTKRLEAAETELLEQKKAPLIAEIFELEDDEDARDNWYPTLSIKRLEDRRDYVKAHAVPKTMPLIKRFEDTQRDVNGKVAEYKASVIKNLEKANPALARILQGGDLTAAERADIGGSR